MPGKDFPRSDLVEAFAEGEGVNGWKPLREPDKFRGTPIGRSVSVQPNVRKPSVKRGELYSWMGSSNIVWNPRAWAWEAPGAPGSGSRLRWVFEPRKGRHVWRKV